MKKFWFRTIWADPDGWTIDFEYSVFARTPEEAYRKADRLENDFEKNSWASNFRKLTRTGVKVETL